MIVHWLNVHLWGPMWPNMFAPSAITLAAVGFTHVRGYRQRERQHEDMKQHVTDSVTGNSGSEDR